MIQSKFGKISTGLFALLLLFAVVPALPVAAGTVTLDPTTGPVDTTVTVSGSGFADNTQYRAYFSNQEANLGQNIDVALTTYQYLGIVSTGPASGNITPKQYDIPDRMESGIIDEDVDQDGIYYVYITEDTTSNIEIEGKATFRVSGFSSVDLGADEGFVDDEVTISGEGFEPGEEVQVFWDGDNIEDNIIDGDLEVDGSGDFDIVVLIPEDEYGPHDLMVQGDESFSEAVFEFSIFPSLVIDPVQGQGGDSVLVSGKGFNGLNYVDIYLDNTLLKKTVNRTSRLGSFSELITLPEDLAAGAYTIKAEDEDDDGIDANAAFTVQAEPLDPAITLDATTGKVGDTIGVSGVEFEDDSSIALTIDNVAVTPVSPITSTSAGTFSGSFVIPELAAGSHELKASVSGGEDATASFTVTSRLAMSPSSGQIGDEVTVTGDGLPANTEVEIRFDDDQVDTDPGNATTDANGNLECTFDVPAVNAGAHEVDIEVGTFSISPDFTTSISFSIAPTSGRAGTEVTINAEGMPPSSPAVVSFGTTQLAVTNIDSQGLLNLVFPVPNVPEGTYQVKVVASGVTVSQNFTTSAEASFSPTSGPVGTAVTVTGQGFAASTPLSLTWDGEAIEGSASLATTASGTFNVTFFVPASPAGNYTISISDGTVTKTAAFSVQATTPPIPQPVAPAMYARPSSPVLFDWQPVSYDIMAVTYQLQVARDSAFASPVIDKQDLATTEYILGENEKLANAGPDNPYFWRVRAVDEAGNTSQWSGAGEFYYGSTWPSWLTWLLIGLGVVVLGILTFWLGRRISYYSY